MANPQAENGYTKIANEIMEALAGIRISGEARQCLDVIIRKTYGYNKKDDHIALSQFYLLTKMPKSEICRALRKLATMNLVIGKKANDNGNIYRFNKDYSTWKPLAKKPTIGKDAKGRWQKSQSALAKKGHTKDNTTKDNTKDILLATPTEEFNFPLIKEKMLLSADKRMPIISLYWNYQKIEFKNRLQYSAGIKRELRPARNLTGYPIERIKEVMYWLNGEDFLAEVWTLETVHKYIDRDLNLINEKKYEKPKRTFNQTPKEY